MTLASFTPHLAFGLDPIWVSVTVLAVIYAFIIAGRSNRAVVALIGAAIVIIFGALDQAEAVKGIDWDTIGLLTGMMILVAISRRSGLFQYLAIWSAQRVKANPAGILLMLQITTAVLSALLNNVSTVLLVVPVTLVIAEELDIEPYPFLFAEVFASNIGGTATLIGDPPNIMIGSQAGFDFNSFIVNVAPAALVVMVLQAIMVHLTWGRGMRASPESRALVMGMNARGMITDWVLLRRSALAMAAVLVAFVFARPLRLEPATIALTGAAVLMLIDNWRHRDSKQADNVHNTFAEVEWTTIFFFLGLFVVVHAVEASGVLGLLAGKVVGLTGARIATAGAVILVFRLSLRDLRQHPVRRHDDPADQEHGAGLWRAEGDRALMVVPRAWCLPRRQRHPHRRRVEPCCRRHCRAQRHPLRFCSIPGLRCADDPGVDRVLPSLRLGPILLIDLTFLPPLHGSETAIHLLFAIPANPLFTMRAVLWGRVSRPSCR
jgi:Na+/H+ antiporter NhaD/arsenite permease-like protein